MKFTELGLSPNILEGISRLGFETPTPVQSEVIPVILEDKRDVVALAQTGTGKTAAFGLPLLQMLTPKSPVPQALVLCPTRELCMQITRDLQSYATALPGVRVLAVYGGADIRPQLSALERGVQVVVATPGRMLDILRRERVDFSQIDRVVLDEADEMLNMGFVEDLESILSTVPDGARTLLFSATMPREVAQIAKKYMREPVEITVGNRNARAENVNHEYYVVHARDRYDALRRIVDVYPRMYGIVFCRTRLETQDIADYLGRDGYNAEALHGDLSQHQRDAVMKHFREGQTQILVATDVAARGLDVNDLSHVINYNLPDELHSYTHRTGRTGRAGKEGIAVAIVHMREHFEIKRLERLIGQPFTRRPVPTGDEIVRARLLAFADRLQEHDTISPSVEDHLAEMLDRLENLTKEDVIKRFVSVELEHMLDFYRNAPDLNVGQGPRGTSSRGRDLPRGQRDSRDNDGGQPRRPIGNHREQTSDKSEKMVGLIMNLGGLNGISPPVVMGLVNELDPRKRVPIGIIKIVRKQTYFEVPESEWEGVVNGFAEKSIELGGRVVAVGRAGAPIQSPTEPMRTRPKPLESKPSKKRKDKPRHKNKLKKQAKKVGKDVGKRRA